MLRRGELDGTRVLSPAYVDLMTREVTVPRTSRVAGLGSNADPLRADHYALGWGKPGVASHRLARRRSGMAACPARGCGSTRRYDLVYVYLSGAWGMSREPIDVVEAAIYAGLSSIG